ncbi:DUF2341 domain-containing protein, partial [Patescibacteria group bacterium]|nr:DUF2341 domain-containing protein [Patescibacteria group bacterium]
MLKQYKDKLIAISAITLIAAGTFWYVNYLMNKPLDIEIPKEFTYNGTKIALAWTDDNTGENLIIQSDKKEYNGFSSVDVYFSITNISRRDQDMDVVVWVENERVRVEDMERIALTAPSAGAALGAVRADQLGRERGLETKSINGYTTGYSANDQIESGQTNYYKATIKYPAKSNGEFFIEAFGYPSALWASPLGKGRNMAEPRRVPLLAKEGLGVVSAYGHLDPWYSSSYQYKRQITINASQIATTTDAFPVLATTTLADLKTVTNGGKVGNDNGYDIIFVDDDDATLLNFEQEKYASTTGEIAYWIKTDISSTTDKVINMYYGNSGASDVSTTTGVWDDNYVMVQHMHHDWDATALDSTSNNNDGTNTNFYSATSSVTAQIDGAIDFDGADDYVDVADADSLDATNVTLSAWVKSDTVGRYIVAKDPPGLVNSKSETLNSKQNPNDKFQITNPATSLRDNGAGKSQITNSPPEADHPWAGNNQNIFKQKFDFAKQKIVDFVKNNGRKVLARFWGKEAPQSPAAGDCGEAEDNKNPLLPVPLFAGGGVGGGFDGADGVDALIKSSRENDSVVSKNGFTKEYKAENKSLKIYGENTSIEMELLSPYTKKVSAGEAVLIAEMRLKDWEGKDNLFDELGFYDRKDYQKLEKQFTYKYAEEITVQNCIPIPGYEDKGLEHCVEQQTGDWDNAVEFTKLSELPHKDIRIGIFTKTILGEKIEWLPTIDGFNIYEWAAYDVTELNSLEHDTVLGQHNSLVMIDSTHFILAYMGELSDGYISTFSIDGNYAITELNSLEHDTVYGYYNSLVMIDSTHFILAYAGTDLDGYIKTFSIDGNYVITQLNSLEHDIVNGQHNSLVMIDSTHFILAYAGELNDGYIKTFSIDGNYAITELNSLEHDIVNGYYNSLVMIDSTHFILAYMGTDFDGYIKTFSIDGNYAITELNSLEHDIVNGYYNSL